MQSNENPTSSLTACPGCDLLIPVPAVPDGHYIACGRCGTTLSKSYINSIDRVLALSFAGLLLYLPAMFLPLMTLSSLGLKERGSVVDTCIGFYQNGYVVVSIITFVTAVIVPFLKIFIPFLTAVSLKLGRRAKVLIPSFKLHKHLEEWGMVEIYLLGILITLIKMGDVASIDFNLGFFCFIGLVLLSMAVSVSIDRRLFWYLLEHRETSGIDEEIQLLGIRFHDSPKLVQTAANLSLMRCHDCGKLVKAGPDKQECPRCDSSLHFRTQKSLSITWALVITSLILFFPANMLPIMQVDFLGVPDRSTILDGIIYFFTHGSIGIGLIILIASILVPLYKIIGLVIILLTIHSGKNRQLKQKSKMFRFIEFIGRWSMLDIFVVAILTVLVDFGFLTSIHTAPGATYFCLVVIATMSAAIVFDPRILWDACDPLKPGKSR
ncbi:MAG: paraquat-inducible protein A [Desulfofustis sp.]|nr:paraquat-inducible protein A [Desulfofustis sp.]MBT8355206.1 paraquat-inducible protein A [Desulfofustis sp.]